MKSQPGLLANVAKRLRGFASRFKEKPKVELEDFELEHFMLYHGLVGNSPENQRQFRTVRADIQEAIERKSSQEMAIVLKIPPLWWEDKLIAIFAEFGPESRETILDLLAPSRRLSQMDPAVDLLMHEDWRVRANAARMLAWHDCRQTVPQIVTALNDTADSARAGFCHLAASLGKMPDPAGRAALVPYLKHEEPWFQVDAAAALAAWPLNEVGTDLLGTMLERHLYADYMAVAIARNHKLDTLLGHEQLLDEALEVLLGVMQASESTFSIDLAFDLGIESTLPLVLAAARSQQTPRRMYTAIRLCEWLDKHGRDQSTKVPQTTELLSDWSGATSAEALSKWLSLSNETDAATCGQVRYAIKLCGVPGVTAPVNQLLDLTRADFHAVTDVLDTLSQQALPGASERIVALSNQVVNIDDRTAGDTNRHSVFEEDARAVLVYWHCLKALAIAPGDAGLEFLLQACRDSAPDKRQRALESLACCTRSDKAIVNEPIKQVAASLVADPAHQVRIAAVQLIAAAGLIDLLPEALTLMGSKEASVRRAVQVAASELSQSGHRQAVVAAVTARIGREQDSYNRQRLQELLDSI